LQQQQQTQNTHLSQKVPTFKLPVSLPNRDRFSKFLHCWKTHEICCKTVRHYPPHLRHVATLYTYEFKNSNFLHYSADMKENVGDPEKSIFCGSVPV